MELEFNLKDLKCRGARESDISTFGELIERAFPNRGIVNPGPALAASIEPLENIQVIYLDNEEKEIILGVCPIRVYPSHFGPNMLTSGALSLVAVDPAYQRRGIGQKLLRCAERYMHTAGFDIGILFTGSPVFYQHTDWAQATGDPYCEIHIPDAGFPCKPGIQQNRDSPRLFFRWIKSSDLIEICTIYEEFNRNKPLTRIRDEKWWIKHLERQGPSKRYLGVFAGEKLHGYCKIELHLPKGWNLPIKFDTPHVATREFSTPGEPRLEIQEYATTLGDPKYTSEIIVTEIIQKLCEIARDNSVNIICTNLPPSYAISRILRENGAYTKDAWWSPLMILIVDVPGFTRKLKAYQEHVIIPRLKREDLEAIDDFSVGLAIKDPRRNKDIRLYYEKTGMACSIHLESPELNGEIVPITRQQLALLVFGSYTPRLLVDCDMWTCPDDLIEKIGLFFPITNGMVYRGERF